MNQVNRRRWSLPLGAVESCWENMRFNFYIGAAGMN